MRVLYDVTALGLSSAGVARYVRELRAALEARPDVELLAISAGSGTPAGTAGRIARGLRREGLFYPFALGRSARRAGADVVHLPASFGARRVGPPVVLTIHDALPWTNPELFTRANVLQQRLLVTGAARRAARVITSTEHARREIVEHVGVAPGRVVTTRWGVHERFRPADVDPGWLRERFGIPGPYVLTVGTLEPRKNLATTLEAFGRLAPRHPDLSLVVVGGDGWRFSDVGRRLGASGDRVIATGFVDDDELASLYAAARCFAFPSLGEGFGWPPLEAMAAGTPVVAADRSSMPEVLGDAALLVDPLDADAVADAVEALLGDAGRASDLRRRGLERAAGHTWSRCAEQTLGVYRDALGA